MCDLHLNLLSLALQHDFFITIVVIHHDQFDRFYMICLLHLLSILLYIYIYVNKVQIIIIDKNETVSEY